MFVKAYNETREHGGINGLTPSEMFLQRLIKSDTYTTKKQESVTHVGKQNCYLSVEMQQLMCLFYHLLQKPYLKTHHVYVAYHYLNQMEAHGLFDLVVQLQ